MRPRETGQQSIFNTKVHEIPPQKTLSGAPREHLFQGQNVLSRAPLFVTETPRTRMLLEAPEGQLKSLSNLTGGILSWVFHRADLHGTFFH